MPAGRDSTLAEVGEDGLVEGRGKEEVAKGGGQAL